MTTKLHFYDTSPCVTILREQENGVLHAELRKPGADISDLPEDQQAEIKAIWTKKVIADFKASEEAFKKQFEAEHKPILILTKKQLLFFFLSIGVFEEDIEAALKSTPEALIEWKYSETFLKENVIIEPLFEYFDIDAAEIEAIFQYAAGL